MLLIYAGERQQAAALQDFVAANFSLRYLRRLPQTDPSSQSDFALRATPDRAASTDMESAATEKSREVL